MASRKTRACRVIVMGEPQGKGRPRFTALGKPYTPKATEEYEGMIAWEFTRQCRGDFFPEGTAVRMTVLAYSGIPKSASKDTREAMLRREIRPTKKPDVDNVLKAVCDGLNGVAYHDDAQVVEARICRYYNDEPRVEVYLSAADADIPGWPETDMPEEEKTKGGQ